MAMRLVVVFVLIAALTGCLKKASNESASMEPAVTEETAPVEMIGPGQDEGASRGKSVSVKPVDVQGTAVEKPSILDIQQALKNANLYEGNIDGISGPKTRKAIEAFQSKTGLNPDGKVGPKTWQKLKEFLNKKAG